MYIVLWSFQRMRTLTICSDFLWCNGMLWKEYLDLPEWMREGFTDLLFWLRSKRWEKFRWRCEIERHRQGVVCPGTYDFLSCLCSLQFAFYPVAKVFFLKHKNPVTSILCRVPPFDFTVPNLFFLLVYSSCLLLFRHFGLLSVSWTFLLSLYPYSLS